MYKTGILILLIHLFNTIHAEAFYNENDTVIFTGQPSLTATEAVLVQEAKNSLDSLGQNQDIQNMTKK
jgi:hypothetical protein